MDLEWFTRRMQQPVEVETHDCNNCQWLNLTEKDRRLVASQGLPIVTIHHKCEKYNKQVYHRREDYTLFPCYNCVKDGYKYFTVVRFDPSR